VKDHSGILLNEFADVLPTRGLWGEPAKSKFVLANNEDKDATVYEMIDDAVTLIEDWDNEDRRIQKSGLREHLSG
jgi:hypothetical protein